MSTPYTKGERVLVLKDNGRDNIVGLEGTVDSMTFAGVVVILDDDPATKFRMYMLTGFDKHNPGTIIRRFFMLNDIKKI